MFDFFHNKIRKLSGPQVQKETEPYNAMTCNQNLLVLEID